MAYTEEAILRLIFRRASCMMGEGENSQTQNYPADGFPIHTRAGGEMSIRKIVAGTVLIGLLLSACSAAKAPPKIVMGSPTGEAGCAKETPGTVSPCKLPGLAASTAQPAGTAPANTNQGAASVLGQGYANISAVDLHESLKNKDFILVNVHIPFIGNIAQTDLSIPYDQIDQNLNQLPADQRAKIVLYCSSGRMSSIAAADLVKHGYSNVWNLEGGMTAWQQAGFTIER
jgi:phage shock protein E